MARQPYFVDSSTKQMDVQGSFGGGMVTQAHPEKLRDDQSILVENGDIVAGGVIQARGAYSQSNNPSTPISGNTQGRFRYTNLAGGQDLVAINGQLYTISGNTYTKLNITGLAGGFQTVRSIEAVQDADKMYFATGSGIVIYDGVTASLMNAYAPNGLEALYIGTNGYAVDPLTYLSDTTGMANIILGVTASDRYGVVNDSVTFTAYVQKVTTDTLEYLWEYKNVQEAEWKKINSGTWQLAKNITCTFGIKADYQIRVTIRKQGTTVDLSQYVLPRYKINSTPNDKPEPEINFDDMKLCNRIFIHYDRLWVYGDTNNPSNLYCSHLNKFTYFPRTNIINVTDPLRGALQSVVQYKNFLITFTNGSIQGITGRNPQEFEKFPIHTTLGTKYPYSVQIMKNYITFVGNDNGIYILKSFNYASDDKLNVERIDGDIMDVVGNEIKVSTRILSAIYNNQYYLYIESGGTTHNIYRFYFEIGVWVRDKVAIKFKTMDNVDNVLTTTSLTGGTLYQLKNTVFRDGTNTVYSLKIKSKDFHFGLPHHRKKLKQYQILAKITNVSAIGVTIYLDNNLLGSTTLNYDSAQNTDAQKLSMMASGRFRYVKTELVIDVNELVQLVGYGFVFKQGTPK